VTFDLLRSPDPDALRSDARLAAYAGKNALVTGGLGFIGSNLVHALVGLGANVRVVDSLAADHGGNRFNLEGIAERVDVRIADIRDESAMTDAVDGQQYVFNIAGLGSHLDSLEDPYHDLDVNARGTLVVLESVRRHAPEAAVVHAGSRAAYGRLKASPVDEDHPLLPTEVNSANKGVADLYQLAYHVAHGLNTVSLRLTNTYGPRMLMQHWRQGFINWFVRLAVEGGTFRLYGDGTQVRDLNYVDDVVRAFLLAGVMPNLCGQSLNVGSGRPVSLLEIAETLIEVAGAGSIEMVPFPEEAKRIEIGDYVADTTKIESTLDWRPCTDLRAGLERSVAYYRSYRERYW
jgi:UDP-glucose 4-epimerase